ncbi:serine hydrolase domain-containing protein [Henriciella algicola]|uniref:Class A beta-lactamase-related serine hydrolase n=1 Tax=Henriciella algicola TaxID=1608422 RepID=A0A399R9K9_9PROT|nr:serine hydrolase domain-containing protein [Henriciella algicola]RIJ27473.1 class A beta-lactamase-related serine hydrolase [Henriciella algicola]
MAGRTLPFPFRKLAAIAGALSLLSASALAAPVTQDWLDEQVAQIHEEYGLIALGAGVLEVGDEPVIAVAGTESSKSDTPVTKDAAWHIGSNTKALTALLYARLVEHGHAEWGASVASLFEGQASSIDPAWTDVTIEDLFAHRSGAGQVGPVWLLSRASDDSPMTEQRLETVLSRLVEPPPGEIGAFEYSNLNYIVAGSAIEVITGQSWEDAIREMVFEADGSDWTDGWGFGAPRSGPLGHNTVFGFKVSAGRGSGADNPPALGPAGTAHATIDSHLRLLASFIDEESDLMTEGTRRKLLAPWPDDDADYAMGWGIGSRDELGRIYAHRGSNTMWLSHVELVPQEDTVLIVNTNLYTDASSEAVGALVSAIEARLAEDNE